jgi:hypothetical protein
MELIAEATAAWPAVDNGVPPNERRLVRSRPSVASSCRGRVWWCAGS